MSDADRVKARVLIVAEGVTGQLLASHAVAAECTEAEAIELARRLTTHVDDELRAMAEAGTAAARYAFNSRACLTAQRPARRAAHGLASQVDARLTTVR